MSLQAERTIVGGEAGNTMSKLWAGQVTKNGCVGGSLVSLWEHAGMKKWQICEIWKRKVFVHIQENKKYSKKN